MPPEVSRAIESIQQDRIIKESADGKQVVVHDKVKIKLWSKPQALDMIARHTGGFIEKKEIDARVDVNRTEHYVIEISEKEAKERLDRLGSSKNRIKDAL